MIVPVLASLSFKTPFILCTAANTYSLGILLTQEHNGFEILLTYYQGRRSGGGRVGGAVFQRQIIAKVTRDYGQTLFS